ncbi:TPR repeat-containing protein ZIP4 [Lolium rigidum]|uniref:TPR repeat-containing protein ZIP4 n=1 Tax=Lolium rigidum TaxID=89674 RepID=UPI001F5DD078|nr:TPR repeat-containing protein ZIP4 [Lolium rigidum]
MKISELSPEYRQPPPHTGFLTDLTTVVADVESFDTSPSSPDKLATDFRRVLTNLGSVSSSLTHACRIQIWKLATRLWNACVDRANSTALARSPSARAAEAEIRQAAPELLLLAGVPDEIPLAAAKAANFFSRAGKEWLHLGRLDLATACFEKGTPLVSATGPEEERRVLLDLNLARARAASGAGDQSLAVALLSRSKPLASASPEGIKSLAEAYLSVGEAALATKPSDPAVQASSIITEALDLCDKLASHSGTTPNLNDLKGRCFRFLAVERLQAKDHEGTIRCIRASRSSVGPAEEHPSVAILAIRAWLGSGNLLEAERELERLMVNPEAPEHMCVMAAEEYLASAGPEPARKVLVALAARCRSGGAAAAVRVVTKVVQGGTGSTGRARAISDLVSDERVVALFAGPANSIQRGAMHSLLWSCGAEHFHAKNYDTSADFYERSMLYLSREEESRPGRAQCLRVLTLCHLALKQLDRALEFVNEADKVEHSVHCAFLKIKIHLQKNDTDEAIKQMKTMVGCVDFNPEFLVLITHEAIACKSARVAVASLTFLLGLCSAGKPMSMPEVVVLRNLIELLRREQGTEDEILKYSRRAKLRMSDLGMEGFFGNGAVGGRELNWFAVNSWSMALRLTEEQKYDLSAEFFELAAEFFGGTSNTEGDENRPTVCKALILSVTSMLDAEEQNNSPLSDSDIKKGVEMLSRAGKLLPLVWPSVPVGSDQAEANKYLFLHTFSSYYLLDRMDTSTRPQQLQLVKNFATSKACTPDHLLTLGVTASKGTPPNLLVAEFSLKASINAALASQSPNYRVISIALRNLACLAALQDLSGSESDAVYDVYRQAYKIVVGLRDGEYPSEEGQWLATTAWNKSYLSRRLNQASVARKWMKMGLDLSRHLENMKQYIASMEQCFESFRKMSDSEPSECILLGKKPDECSQQDGAPSTSMSLSTSQPILV